MTLIGQGVEICTSTSRPTNPIVGTMIYETDTASYRWCSNTSPITWIGMIPVGTVQPYAGGTAPVGWLLCAGQSLNASTNTQYADLWSVLGTIYGGSGITAFNLPDLRGRSPFGKDNMNGSAANRITSAASGINGASLNSAGGTETHVLSTGQMPSHNHAQNAHTHTIRANSFAGDRAVGLYNGGSDGTHYSVNDSYSDANISSYLMYADSQAPGIQNTGGGAAHQNMPPTIILNYIIKY